MVAVLATAAFALVPAGVVEASSSLSPRLADAIDLGRSTSARVRHVVVGLSPRDRPALDALLADLRDPASSRFRRFLTPDELVATHAPAPEAEAALIAHLEESGMVVTERFPNRLLVGAVGSTAALERAFGVELHDVLLDGVRHFAAHTEPKFPAEIGDAVVGVIGLDDLSRARPHVRARRTEAPHAMLGRNCCHLGPDDLRTLYDVPGLPDGSGETLVVAGVYPWNDADVAAFDSMWNLPELPEGSGQVCTGPPGAPGCHFHRKRSLEAALDVEYAHALAPGARIVNYMASTRSFGDLAVMYERIVTDDPGHVISTSWGGCEADLAPWLQEIDDQIFAAGAAVGQAWSAASGDHGSHDCRGQPGGHHRLVNVDHPANSPHVVGVGGTDPVCSSGLAAGDPQCDGYRSETAWADSGGGASALFARPTYQSGCGLSGGGPRLVPDVALAADPDPGMYMLVGGRWFVVGGTSASVAMWGGILTRVAEKLGGSGPGEPGPRLYALCGTAAFHDVTAGGNGAYAAGPGYDPITGVGSPIVSALLAAY